MKPILAIFVLAIIFLPGVKDGTFVTVYKVLRAEFTTT